MREIKMNYKLKNLIIAILYYIYIIIIVKIGINPFHNLLASIDSALLSYIVILVYTLIEMLPIVFIIKYAGSAKEIFKVDFKVSPIDCLKKACIAIIFSFAVICFYLSSVRITKEFILNNKYILSTIQLLLFAFPEEIIFRGYFQGIMEKLISNKYVSTILTGFLFGLMHIYNPELGFPKEDILKLCIVFGHYITVHAFYNLIKEKSKSFTVPTIVHAINNSVINYII